MLDPTEFYWDLPDKAQGADVNGKWREFAAELAQGVTRSHGGRR
jgi:hypothetical protein